MLDIFFVILFILIPLGIIKIMHLLEQSFFVVSIPSFLIVSMFAFSYIGIFPLYFGWDEYRSSIGINDKFLIIKMFLYSSLTILLTVLGFAYSKYILRVNNIIEITNIKKINRKEIFIFILLILFCFFILSLYISKIPNIALLVAITDGITETKVARSLMGNDFSGSYHWYSMIMHDLFNIITFSLFCAYLTNKNRFIFLLFLIALFGSSFSSIMATEKGPFIWLIIGLFLTYFISLTKSVIPRNDIFKLIAIILLILSSFYISFMGSDSTIDSIAHIFSRAFAGSIQPAYHYLEFFPNYHDYLYGKSFPNPGGIFPHEPFMLTKEIANWVSPHLVDKGIIVSMPTIFWGEAYANFGFLGVLVIPFLVGNFVWLIHYFVNKLENKPIKIGFIVWLIIHIKSLATTGFSGYFIDFYLIAISFIVLNFVLLTNGFKIKYIKGKKN